MKINPLIIIIGAYGSGKSEYAINLAKKYKLSNKQQEDLLVSLVDMDIVNPYFRSRDVREEFAKEGIEVVAPEGHFSHADLPMLSPKIKGVINDYSKAVFLDVGGDPAGCRVLARFSDDIKQRGYEMHFVINTKRPFTSDYYDIINMKTMLETTAKLKVTELICNTNLMQFTTLEIVTEGIKTIQEVANNENLLFDKYLVLENKQTEHQFDKDSTGKISDTKIDFPEMLMGKKKIVLEYFLKKPWDTLYSKGI
ncbi:MAG: hypothetical protein PHY08_09010 [Candidatus Cloacimonetes bacterium]|jgi:tRNA uridine 5-carbamoylmethylation protein Kti12|nr:hypothetical protein [Candidatus Cloacimonadota bacterium]